MKICNAGQNSFSLSGSSQKILINPTNNPLYSAVDATQYVPLQKLSASPNPLVFKYNTASTTTVQTVTFTNTFIFNAPSQISTLRCEIRYF